MAAAEVVIGNTVKSTSEDIRSPAIAGILPFSD